MMRGLVVVVVLAISGQAAADRPGPTAKDLLDWIDARSSAIKSLETEHVTEIEVSDATVKSITRIVVVAQIARKNGTWRMRREITQKTNQACRGPKCTFPLMPPDKTSIEIGDSKNVIEYVEGEAPKQHATTLEPANPMTLAASIRKNAAQAWAVLERLPDTRSRGRKVHVLVLTDRKIRAEYHIATDTGLLVKATLVAGGGPQKLETTLVTRRAEVDKAVPDRTFDPPK